MLKKENRSHINNLNLYLKKLEKKRTKLRISIKKEIIKIRVEIKQMKKTIGKDNVTKTVF